MRLRFKLLGLVGVTALAACDAPPQGTSLEDVARFQAAVASIILNGWITVEDVERWFRPDRLVGGGTDG